MTQDNWTETDRMTPERLARKLRAVRMRARLSLFWERLAPAILPLAIVIALFAVVSWAGLFRVMPDWMRIAVGIGFALAALYSVRRLFSLRWPDRDAVDRRLEIDNDLLHQPITAQEDRLPGETDGFAQALWAMHRRRLAEQVDRVEAPRVRTGIPASDPYALRAIVPLLLVSAFAWSFGPNGGTLFDVMRGPVPEEPVPARIDAWVSPPSYTGVAPIFLTAGTNEGRAAFTVPEGSQVVVRIAGGGGGEVVAFPDPLSAISIAGEGEAAGLTQPSELGAREYSFTMERGGSLTVRQDDRPDAALLHAWQLDMSEDNAPTIAFSGEIERAVNGTMTLRYKAEDDYRVAGARGLIELADPEAEGALPLYDAPELTLSIPRRANEEGKTVRDLTEHPWAGAEVTMVLEAEDDLGQTGRSSEIVTVLPGRPFSNPLARALVEQRRNLALDANRSGEVAEVLDVLTLYPEETINNASHFLGIVTARTRLVSAQTDDDLRGVVDYLWEVARQIEDGNLSDAEARMRQAQQALEEALERGASDEEIERLMEELRAAMQDYLREFAERMMSDPNMQNQAQQMPQDGQQMDQQTLDDMLDQIEEMAKSGAREQAMDMLSQLQDMMNNLQMGQHRQQQGDGQSQAQQQMNELGDILRQQQELMNETFRENRRGEGEGREERRGANPGAQPDNQGPTQGDEQGQEGEQGDGQQGQGQSEGEGQRGQRGRGQGLQGLEPDQRALRERLEQFMEGLEGMGIDPGEDFDDAGRSMDQAGESLGDSEGEQALSDQGEAMDALRRGANSMMQQMQQAMDGSMGSSEPGGTQNLGDRDPLGRPQRSSGPDFGESVDIPDEIDVRRAREILEAIRKRLGNALSPQLEKEYLERLLDLN